MAWAWARSNEVPAIRYLVAGLVVATFLTGLAVLVFFATVQPQFVDHKLTRVVVRHFSLDVTTMVPNATFDMTIVAYNPNRHIDVHYENPVYDVFYTKFDGVTEELAATSGAPAFHLASGTKKRLDFRAVRQLVPITDEAAVVGFRYDFKEAGMVDVTVRMRARVRFSIAGGWTFFRCRQNVLCSQVVLELSAPSSTWKLKSQPRRSCTVGLS